MNGIWINFVGMKIDIDEDRKNKGVSTARAFDRQVRKFLELLPADEGQKFREHEREEGFPRYDFIVGVSGGADSVALVRSMKRSGRSFLAVHCNFHLRDKESDRDMRFVEDLCSREEIPLEIRHFDVGEYQANHPGTSIEMACRDLRYAWFEELKERCGARRILVAHNSDDNIETMLLNLFRGSGLSGLRGMLADTGRVARPLLGVSRVEILDYLDAISQSFIVDSSNLDSAYRRNFIRNELLPLIESRWPGVRKTLSRTIASLREEEIVSEARAAGEIGDSKRLSFSLFGGHPSRRWLVRRFAERNGFSPRDARQIAESVDSEDYESGRRWEGPTGTIYGERDCLEFVSVEDAAMNAVEVRSEEHELTPGLMEQIRRAPLTEAWLPGRAEEYEARRVQPGDRIRPLGMNGSKLVSKLMKDAKYDHQQKQAAMVIVDRATGEILWVPGLCRSRRQLVSASTLTVVKFYCVLQ